MCYPIIPDENELDLAQKLRTAILEKYNSPQNDEDEFILKWIQNCSDGILTHWIRYGDEKVELALEKLITALKWRFEKDVDSICEQFIPNEMIMENFVFELSGATKYGHPILYVPAGTNNIRAILDAGLKSDFEKFVIKIFESASRVENSITNKQTDRFYFLIDLDGFSLSQLASAKAMTDMINIYEKYYPFYSQEILMVNTPSYFGPVLTMFKGMMSEKIFDQIKQFNKGDDSWKEMISEYIDINCLPECVRE